MRIRNLIRRLKEEAGSAGPVIAVGGTGVAGGIWYWLEHLHKL